MGEDNKLRVLFSPSFLDDINMLGNSVIISEYYIEDLRTEITNVSELLDETITDSYSNKPGTLTGFWDLDNKTLKIHISLPARVFSNSTTRDGTQLNIESSDGEGLVRLFRFKYGEDSKTAFIIINDLEGRNLKPIKCNQDRILLNVKFPDTTKANIKTVRIEKDTKFLEGYGVFRGDNIFFASSDKTLASKKSSIEYFDYTTTETKIQKKEVPYISNSGAGIYRRDSVRVYTGVTIYCSGLLKNIQPHTRPKLDKLGGLLRIYGDIKYLDYEIRGTEYIYTGEGTESIDGIPDVNLILTEHADGLIDVSIIDKFYIKYGIYEGQPDPSVLIKAGIYFYNPITKRTEYIESKNIRLTQEEEVIPQWEVIYRSTEYTESTIVENIPVYIFPWESGYSHTFTVRTTLPDINIEQDFYMEYEDPILQELFDYTIEKIDSGLYPIVDYKVTITSKTSNSSTTNWLPIINDESTIKISTLILREYEYYESFYFVQGPKVQEIEIHDSNNNNISEIILESNQTAAIYYPVAPEARESGEIGERNTWIVLDVDHRVEPQESRGILNPNNLDNLENKLLLNILAHSNGIEQSDIGKIILGRVKESESGYLNGWRSIVSMGRIAIPIIKRGSLGNIISEESVILGEINLYRIKVTSNGPFACWMNESDEYCFFNPDTNLPTYTNYYYSRRFDPVNGYYVYIALHNTTRLNEEPIEVNKILFTVVNEEPEWDNREQPDCFNDPSNLASCRVFIKAPSNPDVSYINPYDMYVFLDSNSKEIRFKSIETPQVDRLQVLENNSQHNFTYNISFASSPVPVYTTLDNYKYHKHEVQNLNDPFGYYPISPSYIYRVHSTNYTDSNCVFWLFMKAKEPGFYRTDLNGNTLFIPPNPNSIETENRKTIIIRSRYEIETSDIVADLNISGGFTINTISHTILETSNDYRHQYSIVLEFFLSTEHQRTLGTLIITSRIYNLISFNSSSNFILPSYTLTQTDIDRIVPPSIMRIPIVQTGVSGEDESGIEVIGNRNHEILSDGETRDFTIRTGIEIEDPILDLDQNSEGFCTFSRVSTEGFSFIIPPRYNTYNPEIPSDQHDYIDYSEPREINFSLLINPRDIETYQPYSEQFSFIQPGILNGLMYASPGDTPRMYLGDNEIIENVSYNTTELNVFLGTFNIENQIIEGDKGQTNNIKINTGYTILTSDATYANQRWTPTVNLSFPENTTGMTVDRVFIITSGGNKITLIVRQLSARGNIVCNDNAYFLSHGECIETENYENNMGFFTFDTDIDIKTLSLRIPESLLAESLAESYNFIYIGASPFGDGYTRYKAQIKLKPNLSNSVIRKQIFSFIRNGESIRNIYINQGYYCLTLHYPESNHGVYSGGTIGSNTNPIEIPSRDNTTSGTTRKLFNTVLSRGEFNPETGRLNEETIDILNESVIRFPVINSFTWIIESVLQTSRNSIENSDVTFTTTRDFLDSYETKLFIDNTDLTSRPFLENIYTVNPTYYESVFIIKVEASIKVEYPLTDPLKIFGKTTKHNYTIYLKKVKD